MRASRGLKWENKMYKPKRSIELNKVEELIYRPFSVDFFFQPIGNETVIAFLLSFVEYFMSFGMLSVYMVSWIKWRIWAVLRLEVMFNKRSGVFYRGIKPRDEAARVYSSASKTFHEKRVSWESEQRLKLWGEILAYMRNKLRFISILFIKNVNEECFSTRDVLSIFL